MVDFFDKVRQSVQKGVATVSVKSKEALETSRIKGEISVIEQRRREAIEELGNIVYIMFSQGGFDEVRIKDKCAIIAEIDKQLETRREKLKEIHIKSQEALGKPVTVGTCECGAKIIQGAKFCGKCGKKVLLL
ncbi:zinc ribbon domain-containing protein [Desulfofundulus sp. TPOSR]|uniref:zinc ribbon domain-containing protein n=1 Tax=Desulfofundulus sp. TPOSR TaxID=2714340 RepID=UPI001407890D|nr:zinc ribbon domain-containing protein [Desulfofundulus sp. TPOSR]NHM27194.1 zinc ribbon domain-containing protein [Desulfofundulus sp. TPOSR]